MMADDFQGPNGLAFSPDERTLYVAESGAQFSADPVRHIRVFDVLDDGGRLSSGRVFHTVTPGFADGFRVDQDGNIWTSAGDGVHCIAPDGTLLGRIEVPFTVSNLTFGGRNRSRLFICASHTLFAIYTNQRGEQRP
jgi:gluconolactonase